MNYKIIFVISMGLVLLVSVLALADTDIDPYSYSLNLGRVENLNGNIELICEDGEVIKLSNNDLINTDNIRFFTLTYNDNGITLTDGKKSIEETLTLKSNSNGGMKLVFNDLEKNESYLIIDNNTEIQLSIKGGIVYRTEHDAEGYDIETLQWRYMNPYIDLKVVKGKIRVYYRPNQKLSLGAPSTENANIRINTSNNKDELEYELEFLTGEAAANEEVVSSGFSAEQEEVINNLTENYLNLYQVDSIDELDKDIKEQLLLQLDNIVESYKEMDKNMKEINQLGMLGDILTVLKVYKGELILEGSKVKGGEMIKVKGNGGRPGQVESF